MSSTPTVVNASAQSVVEHANGTRLLCAGAPIPAAAAQTARKPVGYGLPCATCRTYYPADAKTCPVCKGTERVAVAAVKVPAPAPAAPREQLPEPAMLEQERERFLREFEAQLASSHIPGQAAPFSRCVREENHPGGYAWAAICQDCYERLQERVDLLEAALHMDLKEAARIVFDAVWADPSDPSKTYGNAAHALLAELRRRSGITPSFPLLQPPVAD